jgi:hypothetical protein
MSGRPPFCCQSMFCSAVRNHNRDAFEILSICITVVSLTAAVFVKLFVCVCPTGQRMLPTKFVR